MLFPENNTMDAKTFELLTEKQLNIRSAPASYEKDDAHHSRYEPTSYRVLKRLCESGYIDKNSRLIDYGSGKGRVSFYVHHALGAATIGIEYNEKLYMDAVENLSRYPLRNDRCAPVFLLENAENHIVTDETHFYFFNPFSEKILRSVLNRIFESCFVTPRKVRLFFYYPTDSYLTCLMTDDRLKYEGEIDTSDLFDAGDEHEKIVIFTSSGQI